MISQINQLYDENTGTFDESGIGIIGYAALQNGYIIHIQTLNKEIDWDVRTHRLEECDIILQHAEGNMKGKYPNFRGSYTEDTYTLESEGNVFGSLKVGYYGPYSLSDQEDVYKRQVSLFLQQLYREMLTIADEHGGKLPNRVMVFADEIGTIPKIESMEMMFSAGRSRRISMVPIIQSFAQLQKNYGKEGSSIIIDNCQDILFGGFAPNSESADILSKALGNRTRCV